MAPRLRGNLGDGRGVASLPEIKLLGENSVCVGGGGGVCVCVVGQEMVEDLVSNTGFEIRGIF